MSRFILVIAALACLTLQASAFQFDSWGVEIPPPQYDHWPTRSFLEIHLKLRQVEEVCDPTGMAPTQIGCARMTPEEIGVLQSNRFLSSVEKKKIATKETINSDLCVIFVPLPDEVFPFLKTWSIARHEMAHCNGPLYHDLASGHGWYRSDGTEVK